MGAHSLVPMPKLRRKAWERGSILCVHGNAITHSASEGATMAVPSQPLEGFYFDELSKIRVIEPDTAGETQELKDECKEFVESERFSN